jgi:ketosteroid isomerase-like protein
MGWSDPVGARHAILVVMPRSDADIVRSMLDTWEAEDFDAVKDVFDDELEVVDLQSVMGMKEQARGPEEFRRMAAQWTDIFDDWHMDVHEVADVGNGAVLAEVTFRGVGRDSGAQVRNKQFEIYRLVDGKIVEIRVGFRDRAEALDWLGRREWATGAASSPPRCSSERPTR